MNVLVNDKNMTTTSDTETEKYIHYQWEWDLKASPEQLWPYIADTNRFDKDAGLPAYDQPELSSVDGLTNTRRRLQIRMFGVPLQWIEEPFEWIRPYRFGVTRNYQAGAIPFVQPIKQLRILAELNQKKDGGTHLIYNVWVLPRNFLGTLLVPIQIGRIYHQRFGNTFQAYDKMAIQNKSFAIRKSKSSLSTGGHRRLMTLRQTLIDKDHAPELIDRLIDLVRYGDDLTLNNIRPYILAEQWQVSRKDVLSLMLQSTRVGLLDFSWNLLCPLCRVAKGSVDTLAEVNKTIHCDTCNINYEANFDQSVELTFSPNPAIRPIENQVEFCTSGPEATPHIAVQQLLSAGESREVVPYLEPGRYRVRSPQVPGNQLIEVFENGLEQIEIQSQQEKWPSDQQSISTMPTLHLKNKLDQEQLIIIERIAWADHAVTAAEVTTLQQFRDLFAEEALRPGDQISVGSLTVLFTDLCDSTRMYQEIGDAPAFGLVMDHFDVLSQAVQTQDGAIVKTIGDAVMAVFLRPVSAIKAVHEAQTNLSRLASVPPLRLKAAIHHGPSIAVTLNERLDYFGSTVNIAARLEKFSQGGDIVFSDAVFMDPEVQDYLNQEDFPLDIDMFASSLKGFDNQSFDLHRIILSCELPQ